MRTYIPGAAGAADLKFFREDGGVLSCNTVTERVSEVSGMASFHENDKILQQQHRSNTIIHNNIHNNIYQVTFFTLIICCLLYTSPSPRDLSTSRMPSSA